MGEANVSAEQPQACETTRLSPPHEHTGRAGGASGAPPQGPPPSVGLIWRIRDRSTFAALRQAKRVRSGPLTVSFIDGHPAEPPRVAYAIGRKVGNAVTRNRIRRRLRVVVTRLDPPMGPGAYLIGVAPQASELTLQELQATMAKALVLLSKPSLGRSGPTSPEKAVNDEPNC